MATQEPTLNAGEGCSDQLRELGFYDKRSDDKILCDAIFISLTKTTGLPYEVFEKHLKESYKLTARQAKACYRASDLSKTGLINRHEFSVFMAAFVLFDPIRDYGSTFLKQVRDLAVFCLYQTTTDNVLSVSERQKLIYDLIINNTEDFVLTQVDKDLISIGSPLPTRKTEIEREVSQNYNRMAEIMKSSDYGELATILKLESHPHLSLDEFKILGSLRLWDNLLPQNLKTAPKPEISDSVLPNSPGPARDPSKLQKEQEQNEQQKLQTQRKFANVKTLNNVKTKVVLSSSLEAYRLPTDLPCKIIGRLTPLSLDWRGQLAAPQGSDQYTVAADIVNFAHSVCKTDGHLRIGKDVLIGMLGNVDLATRWQKVSLLVEYVQSIYAAESSVVEIASPAKVFGNVYGSFWDLMDIFNKSGFPSPSGDIDTVTYVFNGNFIGFGNQQFEVFLFLTALKCLFPRKIFLIRGKAEFTGASDYGFASALATHMPSFQSNVGVIYSTEKLYAFITKSFSHLPLCGLIDDSVLVLNGGIGDGSWGIKEIKSLENLELDNEFDKRLPNFVHQILWSQPVTSVNQYAKLSCTSLCCRANGCLVHFPEETTAAFCYREGIQCIIKSGDVKAGLNVAHGGRIISVNSTTSEGKARSCIIFIRKDAHDRLRISGNFTI